METILVSRFNWPHPSWNNDYGAKYQGWINERLDLFEKYTVRSFRNCYEKPDRWVILVADFADNIIPRLEAILKGLEFSLVVYRGKNIQDSIREALRDIKFPQEIRMSRLDTDDLIASDYFAQIRTLKLDSQKTREGVAVSFPGGANYVASMDKFYYSAYPANPFITYVEHVDSIDELRTVFYKMHNKLPDEAKNQRMLRSFHPMWASLIHESNLANDSLNDTNRIELANKELIKTKFGIRGLNN